MRHSLLPSLFLLATFPVSAASSRSSPLSSPSAASKARAHIGAHLSKFVTASPLNGFKVLKNLASAPDSVRIPPLERESARVVLSLLASPDFVRLAAEDPRYSRLSERWGALMVSNLQAAAVASQGLAKVDVALSLALLKLQPALLSLEEAAEPTETMKALDALYAETRGGDNAIVAVGEPFPAPAPNASPSSALGPSASGLDQAAAAPVAPLVPPPGPERALELRLRSPEFLLGIAPLASFLGGSAIYAAAWVLVNVVSRLSHGAAATLLPWDFLGTYLTAGVLYGLVLLAALVAWMLGQQPRARVVVSKRP